MPKKKSESARLHFEQVPLEVVKKVAEPLAPTPKPSRKPTQDKR